MDDFLHNLRSGKLKQVDRGNRNYNDPQFKGAQRRTLVDRRNKRDIESFERLNAIKEVLETLSETQKRMAIAYEARTRAEERKARAMEVLAKNLYKMVNPEANDVDELFAFPGPSLLAPQAEATIAPTAEATDELGVESKDQVIDANDSRQTDASKTTVKKLSEQDRHSIAKLTSEMREEGQSWEKIARFIAAQGYPTVSGKGTWRGVMVKNLFEKMESELYNS